MGMDFYDACRGPLFHPGGFELTKRAVAYCGFKAGSVIADIGCGTGESARLIEQHFPLRVLNVEPSVGMAGGNAGIIRAAAERIPLADGMLDGVLCECVLSLTDDIGRALRELCRVLRPSGFLMLSDVYSKEERVTGSGALKRLYTKEDFHLFLAECGFEPALFEDHTRELAKMAARLILEGRDCAGVGSSDPRKTGYFLMVAKKCG